MYSGSACQRQHTHARERRLSCCRSPFPGASHVAASPLADRSSAACLAVGLQRLHLSDRPREVPAVLAHRYRAGADEHGRARMVEAARSQRGCGPLDRPPRGAAHLARMVRVSGWAHQPRRLVLSVSSPRRAACTTTSRARWRTAPWSTPSSPPPTASSGWSLESRGLEAQNRDQGAHGNRDRCCSRLVYSGLREVLSSRKLSEFMLSSSFCYSDELE